jgi:hypothetical protein
LLSTHDTARTNHSNGRSKIDDRTRMPFPPFPFSLLAAERPSCPAAVSVTVTAPSSRDSWEPSDEKLSCAKRSSSSDDSETEDSLLFASGRSDASNASPAPCFPSPAARSAGDERGHRGGSHPGCCRGDGCSLKNATGNAPGRAAMRHSWRCDGAVREWCLRPLP